MSRYKETLFSLSAIGILLFFIAVLLWFVMSPLKENRGSLRVSFVVPKFGAMVVGRNFDIQMFSGERKEFEVFVANTGRKTVTHVRGELRAEEQSLVPVGRIAEYGDIAGGSLKSGSFALDAQATPPGVYLLYLDIKFREDGKVFKITAPLRVSVVDVGISRMQQIGEEAPEILNRDARMLGYGILLPAQKTTPYTFTVENHSGADIQNFSFDIVAPKGITLEKKTASILETLTDGSSHSGVFVISPNIDPGIYPLRVEISYQQDFQKVVQTQVIPLGIFKIQVKTDISDHNNEKTAISQVSALLPDQSEVSMVSQFSVPSFDIEASHTDEYAQEALAGFIKESFSSFLNNAVFRYSKGRYSQEREMNMTVGERYLRGFGIIRVFASSAGYEFGLAFTEDLLQYLQEASNQKSIPFHESVLSSAASYSRELFLEMIEADWFQDDFLLHYPQQDFTEMNLKDVSSPDIIFHLKQHLSESREGIIAGAESGFIPKEESRQEGEMQEFAPEPPPASTSSPQPSPAPQTESPVDETESPIQTVSEPAVQPKLDTTPSDLGTLRLTNKVFQSQCGGSIFLSGNLEGDISDIGAITLFIAPQGSDFVGQPMDFNTSSGEIRASRQLDPDIYRYRIILERGDHEVQEIDSGRFSITLCVDAPTVDSITPPNGSKDIPLDQTVVIVFSRPMDRESVEHALSASFDYDIFWIDSRRMELHPRSLEHGKEYMIKIAEGALDTRGFSLSNMILSTFQTVRETGSENSEEVYQENTKIPQGSDQDQKTGSTEGTETSDENHPPEIFGVDVSLLSQNGGEFPQRYQFTVSASDPEEDELTFYWFITCGYFFVNGESAGRSYQTSEHIVEWRYDSQDQCSQATLTVRAEDGGGKEDTFIQDVID